MLSTNLIKSSTAITCLLSLRAKVVFIVIHMSPCKDEQGYILQICCFAKVVQSDPITIAFLRDQLGLKIMFLFFSLGKVRIPFLATRAYKRVDKETF